MFSAHAGRLASTAATLYPRLMRWRAGLFDRWYLARRPGTPAPQAEVGLRKRVIVAALLFLAAVAAVTWQLVESSQRDLIEFQAINIAETVARHSASSRSVYADEVAAKLKKDGTGTASEFYHEEKGNVPLPAQFLKMVGARASGESAGLYRYSPVSKWNMDENQGLRDEFQRWAWAQLEAQDRPLPGQPIDWQPVWRVESKDGVRTLRYMRADPAVSDSCVSCHNRLEQRAEVLVRRLRDGVPTHKEWKLHQLLGALEVDIPLQRVEAIAQGQTRRTLFSLVGLSLAGIICVGLLILSDVSRARSLTHRLAWQANHDELTGLINRGRFERRLGELLEHARMEKSTHAMMFLDLDQFKIVNDTCGHAAGDELLRQLGGMLKDALRATDILGRLGGDEFGVMLMHCDTQRAQEVAEKLRKTVSDFRFAWDRRVFEIGVSIGLVSITSDSDSVAELMSSADLACYAAKDAGRNRVHVRAASDAEIDRRRGDMEWIGRINHALEDNRMYLVMQKAAALRQDLQVLYYQEMLLRMDDENGKPVPTGTLIGAAERYNLMPAKLDRWVVQTTFQHIKAGRLQAAADRIVAVNISGASLGDDGFLAFLHEEIRNCGINPALFCLEITETAAIGNLRKATQFMDSLKDIGCLFALDDFGSGLSSFGYLKNLPIDFLKIDGAFIRDIASDPVDRAMVGAIASVGRVMGIPTIAEWVENDDIIREIRALGIDYAQGYGIARPQRVV